MNNETLREIQLVQTEILEKFHKICNESNLDYMIYSGTMLGQVRHRGFIPWDDDIDVVMKREDYFYLLKLTEHFSDKGLFIQHKSTDENFPHHFIRIRANDTLMVQDAYKNIDMHHGVFIDVFPLDYIPNSKIYKKIFYFKLRIDKKIRILFAIPPNSVLKKILIQFLKMFPQNYFFNKAEKNRMRFNHDKGKSIWMADLTLEVDENTVEKYKISEEEFNNRKMVKFEHIMVSSSKEDYSILTRAFGDFNEYPPLSDQIPHHGVIYFKDLRQKQ